MSSPVNARLNVERVVSAEEIWEGWSPEQQRTFVDLCGPAQQDLGYELPGIPTAA